MKNFKIIISLVFLLIFSNTVKAQERIERTPEQKAEKMAEMKQNLEKLQLSAEQLTSFKEISKRYGEKRKGIISGNADRKEKHQQMQDLGSKKEDEMRKILSESQFKTYQELEQQHRAKMKERQE